MRLDEIRKLMEEGTFGEEPKPPILSNKKPGSPMDVVLSAATMKMNSEVEALEKSAGLRLERVSLEEVSRMVEEKLSGVVEDKVKVVKVTELQYKNERSDKIYKVCLLEYDSGKFVVKTTWGRRGSKFRSAVKYENNHRGAAFDFFNRIVRQKINKGYIKADR